MARVWVEREALWQGDLPSVCAISGEPPDTHLPVRYSHLPGWTYLLLFAGVFPFLIALWFAPEPIAGRLPVRAEVVHALRRRRRAAATTSAASIALVVASAALGWPPEVTITAVVAVIVALGVAGWASGRLTDGVLDRSRTWVELRGVHPRFVDAVTTADRTAAP